MVEDKSRAEIRPKEMRNKKEQWFLISPPLKHKLPSKEIFKSQKLLWREPELGPELWHGRSWHLRALLLGVPDRTYPLTARHSPEDILRDRKEREQMGKINVQSGNSLGVLFFLGPPLYL